MIKVCSTLLALFALSATAVYGQLSGTKTIPGDYASLSAAVSALNTQGVGAGGVTFNVAAGYTETLTGKITLTATGTASNPIVFQKSGAGANPVLTAYVGTVATPSVVADGFFVLAGSDYVTIDGIDLQESAANTTTTTVMEFGYGLFKASATDGCQNNVIKNCTITLNRLQNTGWTAPGHNGSTGIAVLNGLHTATGAVTVTAASGTNSNNQLFSNTIQNCNAGVVLVGFAATTGVGPTPDPATFLGDLNNNVGGSSAATGNTILNFGGAAAASNPATGIFMNSQWSSNCSYNTINNNNGSGVNHVSTLRGIFLNSSSTSANANCNNNTITIRGGGTTSQVAMIESGFGGTAAGNTVNINNNTLTGDYLTATTGVFYGIFNNGVAPATLNILNNAVSNLTYSAVSLTGTGAVYPIYTTGSAATATFNINGNTVSNVARTGTTGGTTIGIFVSAGTTGMAVNVNNNNVSNLSIDGTGSSSIMYGIQTSTGTIVNNGNTINNLQCLKTAGTGTLYGIYNISSPVNETYNNNTISNLTHAGTGTVYGLYAFTTTGVRTVQGNTIFNISGAGTTVAGMAMSSSSPTINNNKIYNVQSTSSGAPTVSGLLITSLGTSGVANVYNNLIGDIKAPNAVSTTSPSVRGINLTTTTSSATLNLTHNTVWLNASSSGATFSTAALFATTSTTATTSNLVLKNNIFVNNSTPAGSGVAAAYWRSSSALNNYDVSSNANLFFAGTPSATRPILYDGTTATQTLADFKVLVAPRESVSITSNPSFVSTSGASASFLHIDPTVATQIESGGIPSSITTDFDGDTRNASTPDIGADEFSGIGIDLNPPVISFTPLAGNCAAGALTLTATITDASGVPTSGTGLPVLYWKLNWVGTYTASTGTSLGSDQYSFSLGAGSVTGDSIYYYIVAQDNAMTPNVGAFPAGGAAGFTSNPPAVSTPPTSPLSYANLQSLSGTYTVGAGGNYATLTAAAADYNNKCLSGPVVFSLINATYDAAETFPINFNVNAFASSVNTLTIKPAAGNTAVISGSSTSCIIALNGTDYVTIDGSNSGGADRNLSILNTNTATNTAVICIKSLGVGLGATNNTIKNLNITAGEIGSTTSINTFGIHVAGNAAISSSATGSDNDNLTIQNNVIKKARYGIYARANAGSANDGLVITQNIIGSENASEYVTFRGLDITYAEAPLVSRNSIFNLKQALSANNAAIEFGAGVNDGQVVRNNISGIYSESTSGYGAYGILLSSTTSVNNNLIANNLISDLRTVNYSTYSTTWNAFGIRLAGGTNTKVYNNSVHLFGAVTLGTGTTPASACLLVTTTSVTGLEVRNNIFKNTQTFSSGTPQTFSVWYPASFTFGTSNNNDYYGENGTAGNTTVYNVGRIGSTDYTTLAAWQAAATQDAASVSVNPVFVSDLDLHLNAAAAGNAALACAGAPLAAVTEDYDGDVRKSTPTLGADEITTLSVTLAVAENSGNANNDGMICAGSTVDINSTVTGGTTPTYAWSTGATTANLAGQTPSANTTYTVSVTENGCLATASYAVTVNAAPATPVIAVTEMSGSANDDGSICAGATATLTTSGGTSYAWSTSETSASISTGTAGTYTVTLTDSNGCTATGSSTVVVNALPTPSVTVTDNSGASNNDGILCAGDNATLTASSASSYAWSNSATTAAITVGSAGAYTVTVTDANGCTASASATVTVNPIPTATITISDLSGSANNDGVVCPGNNVTLTASTASTYAWSSGETSGSITVSTAGTYTVTVTDAGCSSVATASVSNHAVPTLSTTQTEPETCVSNEGSIDLSVSPSGSYTYSWSTGATTQDLSSLMVGNYAVTVTDGVTGCTSTTSALLTGPGGCALCPTIPTVAATPSPVCVNATTALSASGLTDMGVTYGISFVEFNAPTTAPYTGGTVLGTVANANLTASGTTATFNASFASSGTKYIYAILSPLPSDPTCRPSELITLVVNALPTASITVADNSGTTNNDGVLCSGASATLTAGGGVSYAWSTAATTAAITVTTAGTYSVTATDANGCTATASSSVVVNNLPTVTIATSDNSGVSTTDGIVCTGGSVQFTAFGASSYVWSTAATTAAITTSAAGTYSVVGTDANGCVSTASATVVVNPLPTPAITISDNSGVTNNDGVLCAGAAATLTASGGTTYVWSTGATTAAITTTTAGTYTVTVTNVNACSSVSSATVVVNALPTPSTTVAETSGTSVNDGTICTGASVTITAAGGTAYSWSTGATTAAITINPSATTIYTVTVTNANGCSTTTSRTITVNPLPTLFSLTGGGAVCATDNAGVVVGLSGSQLGVNYQLQVNAANVGAPVSGTGSALSFGAQLAAGTYTVVATSASGCTSVMTGSVSVTTFNCSAEISDPCACLNNATTLTNGQFSEQVKVNAPTSQTWTVTSINGLFASNSANPPSAPTPITVGTVLTNVGGNMFTLNGRHIDAIGYTITVNNGLGTSLSIGNTCSYPNPSITSNLTGPFCLGSDPVALTGNPGDANIVSQGFTVNGVPSTTFNPAQGLGAYTIVYTVNG
ncbi:MAG: beta strand repeat-containing protein, partial [Chitinophagales bacterium]